MGHDDDEYEGSPGGAGHLTGTERLELIGGDVLAGFGCHFVGADEVGGPSKTPAVVPVKLKPYPKPAKVNGDIQRHREALAGARRVAASAAATIKKATATLKAKPTASKAPSAAKTSAKASRRGALLGAATARKLSPKAMAAAGRRDAAVAKATAAAKELSGKLQAARASVQKMAQLAIKQRQVGAALRKPRGAPKTQVRGVDLIGSETARDLLGASELLEAAELLGSDETPELERYYAAVGELLGEHYDAVGADPDPNNPGFLADGSPDPSVPLDPGFDPAGLDPTGQDDATTLPPPPPMDTFIPDMAAVGGIAYDGSKGTPAGYCGSYGWYTRSTQIPRTAGTRPEDYGFQFGGNPGDGDWPGEDPNQWVHIHGRRYGRDWWNHTTLEDALTSPQRVTPEGKSYGPLVGNPSMPNFARMRVDGKGNMFWFPQEAPDWLTFPARQAAALTAQAAKKAAADAAAADAAAQAKAAADAAAAQAAQDAQNALAESQAASAQRVTETEAEASLAKTAASEAVVQVQERQADLEASKVDAEASRVEVDQMKQAGQILLDRARRRVERGEDDGYLDEGDGDEGGDEGGGDGESDAGGEYVGEYDEYVGDDDDEYVGDDDEYVGDDDEYVGDDDDEYVGDDDEGE